MGWGHTWSEPKSITWGSQDFNMPCVHVYETRVQTDFQLQKTQKALPRSYSFLYLAVQNGVNDYSLRPLTVFKEKMKERTNKRREEKRTGRLLGGEKKELCPVAGTQTGWFGWGMVSQKHLREADSVTMATRRPDRQHVLSLLWLMPAARLALAMARQTRTDTYRHTHMHTRTVRVWQGNEPNWQILCTDKWTEVAKARQAAHGAVAKVMTNLNDYILILAMFF